MFVHLKNRSKHLFSMPSKSKGPVFSWANRPVGVPSYPALPRPAARRPAVRRPAPTLPWFVWVFDSTNLETKPYQIINRIHLSSPKPGHTTGGSGQGGARREGGAGRDRAGRDADKSVRQGSTVLHTPQGIEQTCPERLLRITNKRNSI